MYTGTAPLRTANPLPLDLDRLHDWFVSEGAANPAALLDYLHTVTSGAVVLGLDPVLVLAQFDLETDTARSPWWRDRLNPAGLGITGDPTQNARSQTWHTGRAAALGHLAHLVAYVWGRDWSTVWPATWPEPLEVDQRFTAPINAGYHADTLAGLNNTWAIDPQRNYHGKLAERANRILRVAEKPVVTIPPGEEPSMPDGITYGNVNHPPFVDRTIPDVQNRAWDNLGQRTPVGVCQHSMLGSLWGTDGYFRRGPAGQALTDYGIGGSTDGAQWDGVILKWNDPLGRPSTVSINGIAQKVSPNRAPWANGGSDGLEMDGPAFVRRFGINAINRDLVSIERSDGGTMSTPMSPKQFEAICALSAHWFDVAKVRWDTFPLNQNFGVVTHMLHLEFATKNCPFPPVTNNIDAIQNRIRAILKAGQTAIGEPTTPPPGPVEPDKDWPNGWTTAALAERFGTVMLIRPDGRETPQAFDEKGPISNAWVQKAAELGITKVSDIPPPIHWRRLLDGDGLQIDMMVFDGKGADNWLLYRPAAEVAWRWIR